MILSTLLALCVVAVVVALVVRPLVEARSERQTLLDDGGEELENLLFERESLLAALRDIRFDHEMDKLSEDDFSTLDARYRARAVDVLKQLDAMGAGTEDGIDDEDALDAWIEAEVQSRRARHYDDEDGREPASAYCSNCGESLRANDRFCSQCGTPVRAEAHA